MLPFLLACTPDPLPSTPSEAETEWITDISVRASEFVPTALVVEFTTASAASARVDFGLEQTTERSTPPDEVTTEHSLVVVGLPPLSEVSLQITAEIEGEERTSGVFSAESGQLLPGAPTMEVTINDYPGTDETTFLLSVFGQPCHTAMASLDGTVFWTLQQGADDFAGVSVLSEGSQLTYSSYPMSSKEDGVITRVDLAGEPIESFATAASHHFISITSDGETLWLQTEVQFIDDVEVRGDIVVATDADGTHRTVFSFWDHLEPPFLPEGASLVDWTHANWVRWDDSRESITISTANSNHIVEVSLEGEILRLFGGPGSTGSPYVFEDVDDAFNHPHGVHWSGDGELLVFATMDGTSRAMRYRIDEDRLELEAVWSSGVEDGFEAFVLGEVQELPDGNILINWGSVGRLQIVSPEGVTLWEALTPFENFISQAHLLESPYAPSR